MPTLDTLQLPRIDTSAYGGREAKKIAGHLYQVEEQLRYVLGHLDEDNLSEGLKSKIESGGMSSELVQTLDAITLRVSGQDDAMSELRVSLGGISATVQELGGAMTQLEQTAQGLAVTVEQNKNDAASALQQTAESIKSTVAATYSTKEELTSTVEQRAESILSTVSDGYARKTELLETVGALRLTVENGETSSRLTLTAGETKLSSEEIRLEGVVTFLDLETAGATTINGSNITTGEISADLIKTGVIENHAGTTVYDLNNGTIQMGATSGPHIVVDKEKVRWFCSLPSGSVGPTGVFYSTYGNTWIGATSTFTRIGWISEGLNSYYGMQIENTKNAHFNVKKVECNGMNDNADGTLEAWTLHASGKLEVPAGGKSAVIPTKDYGVVRMVCAESPIPQFFDNGSGVIGEDGKCWLFLRDEFLSCVSCHVVPQWHVTGSGPVTVKKHELSALVEGQPGTAFDWLCILPQLGCETMYCEPSDYDWSDSMDRKDYIAGYELDGMDAFEQRLDNEVTAVGEENDFIEETWPEQVERSIHA